ncbi:MAG: SIMPL domain-containing protein, partial [Ilumatobacteraceae bacterium]
MANVTVCGTATATVQPDSVVLGLGLTHLAPDAAAALDEVAARSARLATMLADHGLEPADWVTDGVNVAEEWDWRKEQRVLIGFRASSGVSATVRTLDRVGEMIGAAVTDCGANVRDLSWRVDADNPARRALLGEAAVDARVRAEAYVAALGVTLGGVESVSELPP